MRDSQDSLGQSQSRTEWATLCMFAKRMGLQTDVFSGTLTIRHPKCST